MYNEYEDYMRSVLGYPMQQAGYNTYGNVYESNNSYFPYRANNDYACNNVMNESRYEDMYPEIYKILKPMIKKACSNTRIEDISDDDLERMTNDIYSNIESDIDVVNVNITTQSGNNNTSNSQTRSGRNMNVQEVTNDETETRQFIGNPTLRDLIKILILHQLIHNRPNRPGRPGMPPRPPMPPRPRPPYRSDFENENFSMYDNPSYPYYN